MIRALLDGRKTQTRRVVKRPTYCPPDYLHDPSGILPGAATWWRHPKGLHVGYSQLCPYGKPGDLLWVRETFARDGLRDGEKVFYRADGESQFMGEMRESNGNVTRYFTDHWERNGEKKNGGDWKPSIHMPRWASRLTLELTVLRVERLKDIRREDTVAEGCLPGDPDDFDSPTSSRDAYQRLWESINGSGSWDANPCVWVLEFRVHKQNVDDFLKAKAA
jgi:hypothetical protein